MIILQTPTMLLFGKKITSFAITLCIVFGTISTPTITLAKPTAEKTNIVEVLGKKNRDTKINEIELFTIMVDVIAEYGEIPESYKSITIDSPKVKKGSKLYTAYQKAVYMDILKQSEIPLVLTTRKATHKKLVDLTNRFYGEKVGNKILVDGSELQYIKRELTYDDMVFYASNYLSTKSSADPVQNAPGFEILSDAYKRLTTEHIDKNSLDKRKLIQGAIEGMSKAANDPYTVYFPPAEATEFSEEMNGEFEGIGVYLDMVEPGILRIISPVSGSPAEKAGIQAGDQITQIDGQFSITKTTPVTDITRRIKGPAGTKVTLTILRNGEEKTISVTREKIKIELVTWKKLSSNSAYIQINSFGNGTSENFAKAALSDEVKQATTVIIDLRNDGGGDLQEVSNILDYFVPFGKEKFKIRMLDSTEVALSAGKIQPFADKKVIFLTNGGTASASEILIGTVQDYLGEKAITVGEKTYGKGSVQTMFPYSDGSSLKYTSARWYTGKNDRTIDKIGIQPDHLVEFDENAYKNGVDNQLEFAKKL